MDILKIFKINNSTVFQCNYTGMLLYHYSDDYNREQINTEIQMYSYQISSRIVISPGQTYPH